MFRTTLRIARQARARAVLACAVAFAVSICASPRPAGAGLGFGAPVALNAPDSIDERNPQLAADGEGHWVAIWAGDFVMVSRSADNGATWSAPAPLWTPPPEIAASQYTPTTLQTDKNGVWLAGWHHLRAPVAPATEWMTDLRVSRSLDEGATWSEPALIDSIQTCGFSGGIIGVSIAPAPIHASIAEGADGRWLLNWTSVETYGDPSPCPNSPFPIEPNRLPFARFALSFDDGAAWNPQGAIFPPPPSPAWPFEYCPWHRVATDGEGGWLAAGLEFKFDPDGGATLGDILLSRSADDGTSWQPLPAKIARGGAPLGLVAETEGKWELLALSLDLQHLTLASSADNGDTWSQPRVLSPDAPRFTDGIGGILADDQGRRLIAWNSGGMYGGSLNDGCGPYLARSLDSGANWSLPSPLPPAATGTPLWGPCGFTDSIATSSYPRLATDGQGRWGVIYPAHPQPPSAFGSDADIFISFSSDIVAPAGDAEIVAILASPAMGAGQEQAIGVVVRNTGQTTWTDGDLYKLAVTSDPCGLLGGASPRVNLEPGEAVPPGSEASFSLTLRAPPTPASCTIEFQMVQEFVEFFGERQALGLEVVATADAREWTAYE